MSAPFTPAAYAVFVEFMNNGKAGRQRVGNYRTLEDANEAIDGERKCDPTLGGLIDLGPLGPRRWRIFVSSGWTELT